MSLKVVGYTPEGRRIVLDEGPSSVASFSIRGELVQGGPGSVGRQRISEREHKAKVKAQA
jgi:hypothetical protein